MLETGVEGDEVGHSEDTRHVTRADLSAYAKVTLRVMRVTHSNPKRIPPKEAKTHSKYALVVTGASTRLGLVAPASATGPPGTRMVSSQLGGEDSLPSNVCTHL